jgi:hypothetical protein
MPNVTAHPMDSRTSTGAGNSARRPVALKMERAMTAAAMPPMAQTIQEGKYEPSMFRDGAPSQALNPRANAAERSLKE